MSKIYYSGLKIDCVRGEIVRDRQKNKPGEGFYIFIIIFTFYYFYTAFADCAQRY